MKTGDLIARFKEIEAYVDAEKEKFAKWIEPWTTAMKVIENAVKKELLDQGINSFKADGGTAYLSHVLSVKVDDRDKFLDFVCPGWHRVKGNWEFLDARVLKDPVKDWIEKNPAKATTDLGLVSTWIVNINIRKPT